jgi:hypothetical protein
MPVVAGEWPCYERPDAWLWVHHTPTCPQLPRTFRGLAWREPALIIVRSYALLLIRPRWHHAAIMLTTSHVLLVLFVFFLQ